MSIRSRVSFGSEFTVIDFTSKERDCKLRKIRIPASRMSDDSAVDDANSSIVSKESGDVIEMLTDGFMQSFIPNMETLQGRLDELTQSQGILIETMQQENDKYVDCKSARNLAVMLSYVRTYQSKLTKIKQDMSSIEDRVGRLQKRAMKLKLQKEKEEHSKAEAHERQLELERQLTAKLAGSEH